MKRKALVIAVVIAALALIAGGTLAYFTAEETAQNVITSGSVKIRLVEMMQGEDGLVDFPEDGLTNMMPGDEVSKIVTVENTGSGSAWVRIKVTTAVTSVDGEEMDPAPLKIDFNTDEWTLGEDGWYYCKAVLLAGEETAPLFENVVFDIAAMGNEYQNCTASVNVVAQAVQAANNGAAVEEAQGWPAEGEE